ncbi:MAG: SCO family protein [Burkholderiaceae bacterium]|nr:SCO family protein [Burkholderiaceae bacterium]MCD8515828.1 SCO family protein [Burkholderiaceae bacterium]MCD8536172.1 SCO family protein [Burkholderiaceae bacterium]
MAWLRTLALVFGLAFLSGCSDEASFLGSDISGGNIGKGWALTDHHGNPADGERFKGKVSVVFFGFTQCPDICPTSLSELHNALAQLGPDASNVQVLMVSVDPERDSPTVMKDYLQVFSDGLPTEFLGLTGTPEEIQQAAKAFRAYYAKVATPDGSYTMDHSASYYLIDKNGNARVLASNQAGPDALAHDLRLLLQ